MASIYNSWKFNNWFLHARMSQLVCTTRTGSDLVNFFAIEIEVPIVA